MPQVIVIDEIGTKLEAMAASTIAQRGIQLVATAHGITIENLILNPSLEMLVGGIQVTLFFSMKMSNWFAYLLCYMSRAPTFMLWSMERANCHMLIVPNAIGCWLWKFWNKMNYNGVTVIMVFGCMHWYVQHESKFHHCLACSYKCYCISN